MEKMSAAAQVTSLDGVNIGEYEGEAGVNSMMALMTQQESQTPGGERIMTSVPSLYPTFHGLMSGATAGLFSAEKFSVSSLPFVKTEGCPNLPNRFELLREQAGNAFRESVSMQSRTVKSLDASAREAGSSHFSGSRTITADTDEEEGDALKAKILAHPQYPCLLEAYIDCLKVGACQEVVAYLESIWKENENRRNLNSSSVETDPELDRFMEAYCVMLKKYQEELTKPFKEAMAFINNIETQLNSLCKGAIRISPSAENDGKKQVGGSSDEEYCSTGEMDYHEADHHSEDRELKDQLLRKYSGYLSSLKQEFMKRKKKGKLPKDARQKLLDWWNLHYKWPYPSENEKVALAEATSLDQKQINNWFINQRKRHWKPSEDMQFVVVDSQNPHGAAFYVERHLMNQGSAFHLDC